MYFTCTKQLHPIISVVSIEESEMIFQKLKVDRKSRKVEMVINRCEIYKPVRHITQEERTCSSRYVRADRSTSEGSDETAHERRVNIVFFLV